MNTEDLILTQGGTFSHRIMLFSGGNNIAGTTAGATTRVQTTLPHCFEVGDHVLINHKMQSACDTLPQCSTISNVVSNTEFDIPEQTAEDSGSNGFVAKPLDLNGLRLVGNVSTRAGANTTDPLVGSMATALSQYPASIVVTGSSDFMAGDVVSIPSGNIVNATVKAVYTLGGAQSADPVRAARCGCSASSTGKAEAATLLELTQPHNAVFSDLPIERKGGTLLDFDFSYLNDDPMCGIVDLYVSGRATRDLSIALPAQCDPHDSFLIGCYTIGLVRGYEVPAHYPPGDYNDSVQVLKAGKAYLRPSGLSF